ncbi:hypothetical protein AB0M95_06285 [Sphaerisporangium sp. NPDC051017]|uniref:hypothetical protein n=1 Tax=Sphaerisporangium sp. NPDC051017 TaxID=3154636 RepID=UPI003448C159
MSSRSAVAQATAVFAWRRRAGQDRHVRYRGTRKNLFDLRRTAVVHNLHVIAQRPAEHQLAA